MDSIQRRERDRMMLTARAVWVGTHLTHDGLTEWENGVLGREATALPEDALAAALARASAGMPVINMAEYRESKKGKTC